MNVRLSLPAADEHHGQLSGSLYLFSVCRHAKLDEKLDSEAARSCADLRTEEAAAPAAATEAGFPTIDILHDH